MADPKSRGYTPAQAAEADAAIAANHAASGTPAPNADDSIVNEQLDMLVSGRGPEDWRAELAKSLVDGTFASEAALSDSTRARMARVAAAQQAEGLKAVQQMVPGTSNSRQTLNSVADDLLNAPYESRF